MKRNLTLGLLRTMGLVAVVVGSGISLGLVLRANHNNNVSFLIVLFVIWVISPFMTLLVACVVSRHWSGLTRLMLYSLMLILSIGSLIGYSDLLNSPVTGTKPAFVFLVVPLISWLLMAIVLLIAVLLSRRLPRRSNST